MHPGYVISLGWLHLRLPADQLVRLRLWKRHIATGIVGRLCNPWFTWCTVRPLLCSVLVLGQIPCQLLHVISGKLAVADLCHVGAALCPCLGHDSSRITLRCLLDHKVDMPGSLGSLFYVPDPVEWDTPCPVDLPDLDDCRPEVLQCSCHIWWTVPDLIGPCNKQISLIKVLD